MFQNIEKIVLVCMSYSIFLFSTLVNLYVLANNLIFILKSEQHGTYFKVLVSMGAVGATAPTDF